MQIANRVISPPSYNQMIQQTDKWWVRVLPMVTIDRGEQCNSTYPTPKVKSPSFHFFTPLRMLFFIHSSLHDIKNCGHLYSEHKQIRQDKLLYSFKMHKMKLRYLFQHMYTLNMIKPIHKQTKLNQNKLMTKSTLHWTKRRIEQIDWCIQRKIQHTRKEK